jgi:hypothetical protein
MPTSNKTRAYWIDKAKGWAEGFLTHPDYGGSPQLDEFNAVMDELMALSNQPVTTMRVKLNSDDVKNIDAAIEKEFDKIVTPELREAIRAIPAPILNVVQEILATIPDAFNDQESLDTIVAAMRDGRGAYQWYQVANKRKIQPAILKLAARLLEDAAESYGSHGCNDFHMEDTPENLSLVSEVAKQNGWDIDPQNFRTKRSNGETVIIAMDYELMAYCAHILKEAANV